LQIPQTIASTYLTMPLLQYLLAVTRHVVKMTLLMPTVLRLPILSQLPVH
jgi:hypothetical protein